MTDIELLVDFYKNVERQGPGSSVETKKALNLLNFNPEIKLKIADIGCGTGAQTITLAEKTKGKIIAIDLFPEFLNVLKANAKHLNLTNHITVENQSMDNLNLGEEAFDLVWSEGAIYIMGFEEGLKAWSTLLKKDGYIVVSEISWFSEDRPIELEAYWKREYPQIDKISNKIKVIEKSGYTPVGFFKIPDYCWIDNYYQPMQLLFSEFLDRHKRSDAAVRLVDEAQKEIELFEKYKAYYGYCFYLAQKL